MLEHGIDLTSVRRIREMYRKHGDPFLQRILSQQERELLGPVEEDLGPRQSEWLAGRFAGKEAVLKALGTGLADGICWRDIEILRGKTGAPTVRLREKAAERFVALRGRTIKLSITHDADTALASCILLRADYGASAEGKDT